MFRTVKNKKAYHNFKILEKYQAGLVLTGSEIKSIRDNNFSFADAFCDIKTDGVYLINFKIQPYKEASHFNHIIERERKLLLHQEEIRKIKKAIREKGHTIIPLSLFMKNGWAKIDIGVAIGKREWDKRADLAKRDAQRSISRALKRR